MESLLFYVFGGLAVLTTLLTLGSKNPVYSAIWMILSFASTAALFVLLDAFLIATVEVLVYAGAIMVLFLFVIMLLNLGDEAQYADRPAGPGGIGKTRFAIAGAVAALLLVVGAFSVGLRPVAAAEPDVAAVEPTFDTTTGYDDLQSIGELLFSRFVVPFEAASLLLLATMIAVILLAKRQRGDEPESRGWPWQKGAKQ